MNKKLTFIFAIFCLGVLITTSVLADNCYTFETGVPFIASKGECKEPSGLANMIVSFIKILFPIAGVLAFVMIMVAGFEYATSGGDTNKQKDAQDRIANAIIGLVLLFAFYLIIYTINPDILKIQNLELTPVSIPTVTPFTSKPANQDLSYFIQTAKNFATKTKILYNSDYSKLPTDNTNLNNYLSTLKTYKITNPETDSSHGASCDMYVAAVLKATIDSNYPATWVPTQYNYLKSNGNFICNNFTSLTQLKTGDILFKEDLSHTALKLDDGYYQASNNDYFPYGPSNSWYSSGIYCRYINFSGGETGGSAG